MNAEEPAKGSASLPCISYVRHPSLVLEDSDCPAGYQHAVCTPWLMGLFEPKGIGRRGMSEKKVKYASQV